VCPVDHCIEMVEVPSGRESVTWDQIVKSRPEVTEDWEAMEKYRKEKGIQVH
jgi:dihydropyrimidine dehydrogenase (NAD+) subunit PreA